MRLLRLFKKCTNCKYNHVENSGDYYTERYGSTLYIYLECSDGLLDWINNFKFAVKSVVSAKTPYKNMEKKWRAHGGFLKVWQSIKPYIENDIKDETVRRIVTVGYSHGAALAVLCHEYIWYNRPDIRNSIEGYGFGCPRVFWGVKTKKLRQRWERFTVIRNINDVVTHVPPILFGFSHVGTIIKIGSNGKYSAVDAHRPENIVAELKQYGK